MHVPLHLRRAASALVVLAAVAVLAGCAGNRPAPGPAERAGSAPALRETVVMVENRSWLSVRVSLARPGGGELYLGRVPGGERRRFRLSSSATLGLVRLRASWGDRPGDALATEGLTIPPGTGVEWTLFDGPGGRPLHYNLIFR
jgi:hypothetical protein